MHQLVRKFSMFREIEENKNKKLNKVFVFRRIMSFHIWRVEGCFACLVEWSKTPTTVNLSKWFGIGRKKLRLKHGLRELETKGERGVCEVEREKEILLVRRVGDSVLAFREETQENESRADLDFSNQRWYFTTYDDPRDDDIAAEDEDDEDALKNVHSKTSRWFVTW